MNVVAFPRRAAAALIGRSADESQTAVLRPRRVPWSRAQLSLVVSASFLLGVCMASAVFVLVWSREANRADSTEAALARATAERERMAVSLEQLKRTLAETEFALAGVRASSRRQQSLVARTARSGEALVTEAAHAEKAARGVASKASSVAVGADRLTNAVAALHAYVAQTPARDIDPAYVATQLAYLEAATRTVQSESRALSTRADNLAATRVALSRRTTTLKVLAERLVTGRGALPSR